MDIQTKPTTDNFIHEEPLQAKRKPIAESIKKKRKLKELQHLNNDQLSSSDDDLSDIDSSLMPSDTTTAKLKKMHHKKNKATAAAKKEMSISDKYKLAKAQLQYIARENEMLCDEWASTEKILKKLKTERKVLLDALVKKRYRDEAES
ncbi:hypothetical protein V8B55DRAFT_1545215 [Mucor lusitanicus]|uniref:No apical meristem-associated C-terminal domain-containing protein n=2 Tax=Mucor circinelloides f. lusitanicus TaxID=29924 RepID=A0A162RJS0_MUCCL|nr:hypothetical protein FB192DRAFT_1390485 [Mucor lusitanicus]OAD06589.1 hypothetical protein MUCCIDRAFT_155359 [Mucor lusitanicus CBS 277.49]